MKTVLPSLQFWQIHTIKGYKEPEDLRGKLYSMDILQTFTVNLLIEKGHEMILIGKLSIFSF